MLAPWIISHFHHIRIYVEPFGAARPCYCARAAVMPRSTNDLDGESSTCSACCETPEQGAELMHQVTLTPLQSRRVRRKLSRGDDPVEQARRTADPVRDGFSTAGATRR